MLLLEITSCLQIDCTLLQVNCMGTKGKSLGLACIKNKYTKIAGPHPHLYLDTIQTQCKVNHSGLTYTYLAQTVQPCQQNTTALHVHAGTKVTVHN